MTTSRPEDTAKEESARRALEGYLLTGQVAPGTVDALIEAGLGGYACDRLAGDDVDSRLGPDDLARLRHAKTLVRARHAVVRQAVAELVSAWERHGIEALLFKGFHLAEYVYPDPSWRSYSDVDVALRSGNADPAALAAGAALVATELGWEVIWHLGEPERVDSVHESAYAGHELMSLRHGRTGLALDVHRRLAHSNVARPRDVSREDAITAAVWDGATSARLCGASVRLPSPVDALLVGVIASRSWSHDGLGVRPSDYLDLQHLVAAGGLSRADVMGRASQLGMSRTVTQFLRRCDPTSGVLSLEAPGQVWRFLFDIWIMSERRHRTLERFWLKVRNLPADAVVVARELPAVTSQVMRYRLGEAARLGHDPAPGTRTLDRQAWRETLFGVRRALQLNGVWARSRPDLALACVYASLARRGYRVTLRSQGEHVWFEHDGVVLDLGVLSVREPEGTGRLPGWSIGRSMGS